MFNNTLAVGCMQGKQCFLALMWFVVTFISFLTVSPSFYVASLYNLYDSGGRVNNQRENRQKG